MGAQLQLSKGPSSQPRVYGGQSGALAVGISRCVDAFPAKEGVFDADRFLASTNETVVTKYRKLECVFAQGDPADSVYYVRHGSIKLMAVSNRGKEATIGLVGNGEFCGEGCVVDEPVRLVSAMTMTSGLILRIQKRSFAKLLRENHDFSAFFTKFLISRANKIQTDLLDQRFHPSEYRLARLLISLSESANPTFGQRLIPRISQETLASMVGTTRSRISFFLNKFKKAGLIEYGGGIRINPALEDLLDS